MVITFTFCTSQKNAKKIDTTMIEQSATLINRQIEYTLYAVDMGGCSSVKDIGDVIYNHIEDTVENYSDFYLCMYDPEEQGEAIFFFICRILG